MKVLVVDPYAKNYEQAVTLDELLEKSDFITVHVPLTGKTAQMIGREEINKMKDGGFLINTARGGVIDESAVLQAIQVGKLKGVALDVYAQQQPFNNEVSRKLIMEPRVIATPHSIGQTVEAVDEKGEGVIQVIRKHVECTAS